MKKFNFKFYGNIYFGLESRFKINEIIKKNNYNKICLIIDHNLLKLPIFENFMNEINCDFQIIRCDISEPTYDKLEEKRLEVDKKIDAFVGIGGGSALDMAKGLSVLNVNHKEAIFYRGFNKFDSPIPDIIAIPTTAGTGSEITPNASFIDLNEKRKMGINGEDIRPKFSILDPSLTLSCPKKATLSAGIDSLVHATEAYVAKSSNTMAKIFAKEGFNIVFLNLIDLIHDLNNIELREKVMFGAFLSAIGLMNSGTGPAAAMSYPLGVHFGVPHGIGGGIFLPHVISHNVEKGYLGYSSLYNFSRDEKSDKFNSDFFVNKIEEIWKELEVPSDLSQFGMNKMHINDFVSDTLELKMALDENPVDFYEEEIKYTLNRLLPI